MYVPPAGQSAVIDILIMEASTFASEFALFSTAHDCFADSIYLMLLIQALSWDVFLAFINEGIAIAARRPIMDMTVRMAGIARRHPNPHQSPVLFAATFTGLMGKPHDGQLGASFETDFPHSGHVINGIFYCSSLIGIEHSIVNV